MSSPLLQLTTKRDMYRLASAVIPDGEWSFDEFERRLGRALGGVDVRYMELTEFTAGDLTGLAVWSADRSTAIIGVPAVATDLHKIHIAGHEAWHLLAGHEGCGRDLGAEADAETFALRLGSQIARRKSRRDRQSLDLATAFGVVGLGA